MQFLVNIWINHVPTETPPFPAKDVSKFSDVSIPSSLLSANQSDKSLVKPSNSARVQGFVFGGRGEEHELWVPEFPQPNPFCDSVIIEYNTKCPPPHFPSSLFSFLHSIPYPPPSLLVSSASPYPSVSSSCPHFVTDWRACVVLVACLCRSDARAFVKRVGGVPRPRPKKKR
jgi:hypothetical protein